MEDNDGNDSGYESDEEGAVKGRKDAIQKKVTNAIADFQNDLKSGEGFFADVLATAARSNGGIIEVSNRDFSTACKSFLEAQKGENVTSAKDVKSLPEAIKAIEKKINKLEKDGINPEYFADFKKYLRNYQKDIAEKLSTNEGIRKVINKRFVNTLFLDVPLMSRDDEGRPKSMYYQDKTSFFSQITPRINDIPPELEKAMLSMLSQKNFPELVDSINQETLKFFTSGGDGKKWGVLDNNKITQDNIKKFANSINSILEDMNSKAFELETKQVEQAVISKIKEKLDIPDKQKEKIIKHLSSALTKLDPDDLRMNKGDIISKIAKDIVKHKTIGSHFTKDFTISTEQLQNVSNQLIEKYGKKNEQSMKPALISLPEAKPEKKINTEISSPIISKVIDAVLKEKNAKIKPEQRTEIEKNLSAALSDIDPEYLKSQADILTKDLTNKLVDKGNTSLWNKSFTIDSSKLEKISMAVKNVEEKKSDKFVEKEIKKSIFSHAMSDSALAEKLSSFLTDNKVSDINTRLAGVVNDKVVTDGKIKLEANDMKSITNQQLVELRKINPKSFDKILFPTIEPTPKITRLLAHEPHTKITKPPVTPIVPSIKKKPGYNITR
ncbi:hypothetical protein [Candidatus Tisiphia endosymbiont of Hybos culiciformis]|uniref:hypothetical protein n=1 Tax=Candidatus Tisiphia endosymbiont of Hybos culiciformis TaxID=3139331 RepID=UPI003CCAE69A